MEIIMQCWLYPTAHAFIQLEGLNVQLPRKYVEFVGTLCIMCTIDREQMQATITRDHNRSVYLPQNRTDQAVCLPFITPNS